LRSPMSALSLSAGNLELALLYDDKLDVGAMA
jgi:hypothetical protein